MIVLGLDPGSRRTGWGVVHQRHDRLDYVASGVVRLAAAAPLAQRLLALDDAVTLVLERHRPDACAVEQIFSARNARSALVLGHARGVLLCAVGRAGVPLSEYAPALVKQTVAGQGGAGKEQVQRMVALLLGRHDPLQEDEADALGVALTHAAAARLGRLA